MQALERYLAALGAHDWARLATCVGDDLYLICNHTQSSMHEIAKNSRWLDAQKAFAELVDRFRDEPLAA